jgi:hypothetical protein
MNPILVIVPVMSLQARVAMILFGGVIFGGATPATVGNLMRLTSGDLTNAVVAGVVAGLGLALLFIGAIARDE